MLDYATVRLVHVTCAGASIAGFAARGALLLAGVDWRRWRWLRVLPHANDTVLLGAAVALALMSGQYPLRDAWLTAKLAGLCLYVGMGTLALRPDLGWRARAGALVAALAIAAYIVGVAVTRSATLGGWLADLLNRA